MTITLTLMLIVALGGLAQAAAVVQTADNVAGTTGFNAATGWSNAAVPSVGNTYDTRGYLLRTPGATGNYTFAGDSLTVGRGAAPVGTAGYSSTPFLTTGGVNNNGLMNKTVTGAGVTITVNNLILDAGYIRDGMGSADVWTLAGNVNVTANGGGFANQCRLNVDSVISGSGPLYVADNGSGEAARQTYIRSALNTYNGNITLVGQTAARCRLTFVASSRMNFVIGASGVNNKISGTGTATFEGDFNFNLTGAGIKVGNSWTIASVTTQTFATTFTVVGFTADADGITWTKGIGDGSIYYEFKESTGILSVKVRPPHTPVPADLATGVLTSTTALNWKGGQCTDGSVDPNIVKYFVYTNEDTLTQTEPNTALTYQGEVAVGTVADASYTLGVSLPTDKTVYWQIEESMNYGKGTPGDPNNIKGPVWRFSTVVSIPVVPANQPASARVFPSDPNAVVFTVDFTSLSTPTVKWYKNATEVTAGIEPLVDNGGGSFTTTLNLGTGLTDFAEGQYYCTVTNSSGPTVYQSGIADLIVNRQLAQYAFAGDLADSSGNSAPTGTAYNTQGDPNSLRAVAATIHYETGADGAANSALVLDPNEYVDFGVNGYPKASPVTTNGYGGGLDQGTIVYWVKPNVAAYQIVLGNFNDTTAGVGFLSALQANGNNDLLIRNGGPYLANHVAARPNRPEYNLTDGNWHMMAACWSGNASTLYVDGQWVGAFTDATPTSYVAWQRGVLLGASRQASRHLLSDMFRGGAIDNLKIYNYRLDAIGVDVFAQEYMDNTGVVPCTNMSFVGNAYNFDNSGSSYCKIDLADFVDFASGWLNDGLYGN
jgi:hypothetical protein